MPKHIRALYRAAWLFIALMLLVDCIWALRIGFRLDRGSVVQTLVLVAGIAAITGLLSVVARVPYKNAARARFYQNVFAIFMWITALIAFTKVCIVFQYLGVVTNYVLSRLVAGALVIWVVRRVVVRAAQPLDRPVASVWAP